MPEADTEILNRLFAGRPDTPPPSGGADTEILNRLFVPREPTPTEYALQQHTLGLNAGRTPDDHAQVLRDRGIGEEAVKRLTLDYKLAQARRDRPTYGTKDTIAGAMIQQVGRNYLPLGDLFDNKRTGDLDQARKKFQAGTASDEDVKTIAGLEAVKAGEAELQKSTTGAILAGVGTVPKLVAESWAAGKVLSGLGSVVPGAVGRTMVGGVEAATSLRTQAGRTALMLPLMPSMYLDEVRTRNEQAGRSPLDVRGWPGSVLHGYANLLVLGRLQGKVLGSGTLGSVTKAAGIGVGEQAGLDVAGGLWDEVMPEVLQTKTRYGVLGDLARGDLGEAAKHATVQALTFAVFAGLHGGPKEPAAKMRDAAEFYVKELDKKAGGGESVESAAAKAGAKVEEKAKEAVAASDAEMGDKVKANAAALHAERVYEAEYESAKRDGLSDDKADERATTAAAEAHTRFLAGAPGEGAGAPPDTRPSDVSQPPDVPQPPDPGTNTGTSVRPPTIAQGASKSPPTVTPPGPEIAPPGATGKAVSAAPGPEVSGKPTPQEKIAASQDHALMGAVARAEAELPPGSTVEQIVAHVSTAAGRPVTAREVDAAYARHGDERGLPPLSRAHAAIDRAAGLSDAQRAEYGRSVESIFGKMPPAAHDRIAENLHRVFFFPTTKEAGRAAYGDLLKDPALPPDKRAQFEQGLSDVDSGRENFGGAYSPRYGALYSDGGAKITSGYFKGRHGLAGEETTPSAVHAHELGHALDGPYHELSKNPGWLAAHKEEIALKAPYTDIPLTWYAATKPSEGFAEFSRLLYGSDVPTGVIAKDFPKASKFFRDRGLWPAERGTGGGKAADSIGEVFKKRVPDGDSVGHADILLKPGEKPPKPEVTGGTPASEAARLKEIADLEAQQRGERRGKIKTGDEFRLSEEHLKELETLVPDYGNRQILAVLLRGGGLAEAGRRMGMTRQSAHERANRQLRELGLPAGEEGLTRLRDAIAPGLEAAEASARARAAEGVEQRTMPEDVREGDATRAEDATRIEEIPEPEEPRGPLRGRLSDRIRGERAPGAPQYMSSGAATPLAREHLDAALHNTDGTARDLAAQLASAWDALTGSGSKATPADVASFEREARRLSPGLTKFGEAGGEVAFDGARHRAPSGGVFTGDPVRVVRAGWEHNGRTVLKAEVESTGIRGNGGTEANPAFGDLGAPGDTAADFLRVPSLKDLADAADKVLGGADGKKAVKSFFRKLLTGPGDLPASAFEEKLKGENRVAAEALSVGHAVNDLTAAVGGDWRAVPKDVLETMDAALRDPAAMASLKDEIRIPLKRMRDHVDALSEELIKVGALSDKLILTFKENIGAYLTRQYQVFSDPKWYAKVPADVVNTFKAWFRGEALKGGRDLTPEELDGVVYELLHDGTAADNPIAFLSRSKLGAKDVGILTRRKDVPEPLRALWGEVKDPIANYAASVGRMANLLSSHVFQTRVRDIGLAEGWLLKPGEYKDGFVEIAPGKTGRPEGKPVGGSKTMDVLAGYKTTPEIKRAFEEVYAPENLPGYLKAYMKVLGVFKYTHTVLSPVTHVRQVLGNVFFNVANGHGISAEANRMIREMLRGTETGRAYQRRLVELGIDDQSARGSEFRDVMNDALGSHDRFTMSTAVADNAAARWLKKGLDFAQKSYRYEDLVVKIHAFENEKARYTKVGLSPDAAEAKAARIVQDTFPTYSRIPGGLKALRRFPLVGSFVSFTSEVVRNTYNTAKLASQELRDPSTRQIGARRMAGLAASLSAFAALGAMTRQLAGVSLDEEDAIRRQLPEWSKNGQLLHLGKDDKGNYLVVDLGRTDPHSNLLEPLQAAISGVRSGTGTAYDVLEAAASPFVSEELGTRVALDVARNKMEKGAGEGKGQVYNPEDKTFDQFVSVTAHAWKGLEPGVVREVLQAGRAASGVPDPRTNKPLSVGEEFMADFTGQRTLTIDPRESLQIHAREFAKRLEDAEHPLNAAASLAKRGGGRPTAEGLADPYARSEAIRRGVYDDLLDDVRAARLLGMTDGEIARALGSAGVSKEDVGLVLGGRYQPKNLQEVLRRK